MATIEANEARVQTLRWACEFRQGRLSDPDQLSTAVFGPVKSTGRVIRDLTDGRYRVDLDSVIRWVQGVDDHYAQRQSWSFDGLDVREIEFSKPGKAPPEPREDRGTARVFRKGGRKEAATDFSGMAGIADMSPNFQRRTLSSLIRSDRKAGRPVNVSTARGVWSITTQDPDSDSSVVIDYDVVKGVVVGAIWRNGTPERPWRRYSVEIQKVGTDRWAPKTVSLVNLFDRTIDQVTYSGVTINEKVDTNDFALAFPLNARVTDFVRKSSHDAGDGTANSPESRRRFLEENPPSHDGTPP